MIELSCYGYLAKETLLLTNTFLKKSPALMKLMKVLTISDTDEQDQMKMAYWAMEIETYQGGSHEHRKGFGKPHQYGEHHQLLNANMRTDVATLSEGTTSHDLYTTNVGFAPACSNPTHGALAKVHKRRDIVTVAEHWYSMPQDWTRVRRSDNQFTFPTCTYKVHKHLGDVVGTLLGRTDGETTECPVCYAVDQSSYQVTMVKDPTTSTIPLFLEFEICPTLTMRAHGKITVGDDEYTLMGVVFVNGSHFKCNVRMSDGWYHYDDLGMRTLKQHHAHKGPATPRFVRVSTPNSYMTPPENDFDYSPVSYRYMRKTFRSLSQHAVTAHLLPSDLQFNNMSRLMS